MCIAIYEGSSHIRSKSGDPVLGNDENESSSKHVGWEELTISHYCVILFKFQVNFKSIGFAQHGHVPISWSEEGI